MYHMMQLLPDDYIADSFMNRSSQDKGTHTNGHLFIDKLVLEFKWQS